MDAISAKWRRKTAGAYETILEGSRQPSDALDTTLQINTGITRPRLLNKQHQGKAIDRFGVEWEKAALYFGDVFHTLLNMPRSRFILIFFFIYIMEYILFALLYLWQPNHCIPHIKHLRIALWFSVQTAATIGYGAPLAPNPECTLVNVIVMFQVITSSLIDYCCMGLVFARFSAPSKRSSSLRFSRCMVLAPHAPSGYWALALRVANMRKHIMIRPEVQILLAKPDNPGQAAFECQELALEGAVSSMANLRLGMAVTMMHVIRPGSPLWNMSIDDLLLQEMEVMVFFEGIDAMTSNSVQARHSYYPNDMRMNERFATLYMMFKGKKLGLDFSEFDATLALGSPEASSMMRRQTFSSLTAAAQQLLQEEQAAAAQRQAAGSRQHWRSTDGAAAAAAESSQHASQDSPRRRRTSQQQAQQQEAKLAGSSRQPGTPAGAGTGIEMHVLGTSHSL
ncbi:hypothetical protein OEZ86_011432 [Tetradesmus obliquus]|nr:hypothetical protein OEZ86_011432 [Tetradesmus obliquus]